MQPTSEISLWQVDAFTDKPFTGNPAAVCLLSDFPEDDWMQDLAAEMNLSETAFVVPTDTDDQYHLRWFTPNTEVELCGHATLASAHMLIEQKLVDASIPVRFRTKSGVLTCQRTGDLITLDFPSTPPSESVDQRVAEGIRSAIGTEAIFVAQARFDTFVVVDDPQVVLDLKPDFRRLSEIDTRGIIVTAKSGDDGIDFISRFFAPRCGIDEDPVTGSAHCVLAPYWAMEFGRDTLVGYQASRRGGLVRTQVIGDRVRLSGQAVTVMKAKLLALP